MLSLIDPPRTRSGMHRETNAGWRPGVTTWVIAFAVLGGISAALYPSAAQWFSSYSQAAIVQSYAEEVERAEPDATTQLAAAHRYNDALTAGVDLLAGVTVPTGTGTIDIDSARDVPLDYPHVLNADGVGIMARLRMPDAGVDLPVYHGTADDTLLKGAGHLEGSHLPVGGPSTRSVITAHRGLANATMFSRLDEIEPGDRFTLETFGEVLTYEVRTTVVIEPHETDSLRAEEGRDLVTLITCTPLGINTHRIVVTGERVIPTPAADLEHVGEPSGIPSFPWWTVGFGVGVLLVSGFIWRAGYTDARRDVTTLRRRRRGLRA